jgi:hypothetical protein
MNPPRDIVVVIQQLLNNIPETESILRQELTEYHSTLWNQAPEARRDSYNWNPVRKILLKHITVLDETWKQTVADIFSNTEQT